MALARVRVSNLYFAVWIVYRTVRKKDFVALARVRVSAVSIFSLGLYNIQLRNKDVLALAMVKAVVSISQFWIVFHTVAQERDRGSRYG